MVFGFRKKNTPHTPHTHYVSEGYIPVKTSSIELDTSRKILETTMELLDARKKAESKSFKSILIMNFILITICIIIYFSIPHGKHNFLETIIIATIIYTIPTLMSNLFIKGLERIQNKVIKDQYNYHKMISKKIGEHTV